MNKYIYILGSVGTALLSACSSDDLTTVLSPEEERALVVEAGKDSDVPIILGVGMGRAMTRTPIESDGGVFTIGGGQLGVFCLAAAKQPDAPSFVPSTIDWETGNLATWLNNVPASVKKGEGGTYSYVEFRKFGPSDAIDRYYPFGNWYRYDFYAYYPRVNDISISTGSDDKKAYFASITIDGTNDIIWGNAIGEDEYAYSSKYSILNPEVVPEFDFKHKLTQLVFYVKPHDDVAAAEFSVSGIKVTDLYLKDVDTKFNLCVASMSSDHTPGELELPVSRVQGNIKVYTTGTNNDAFAGGATYPVATSSTDTDRKIIGYAIVPPIAASEHYTVQIVVKDGIDGPYYDNSYSVTPPQPGGFQAGKKYNIELDIKLISNRDE